MKNYTCLLVDDDIDDQEFFLNTINTIDSRIKNETAVNGHDALEKLISGQVRPDIIFLDLNMPLMNGKQFLKEFSKLETLQTIPVVILSTSSDRGTREETFELGARHFVTKPDSFSEWEQILREVLSTFGIG